MGLQLALHCCPLGKEVALTTCRLSSFWVLGEYGNVAVEDSLWSPLEILKTHLDEVLCSLFWVTLLRQGGWTR